MIPEVANLSKLIIEWFSCEFFIVILFCLSLFSAFALV